MVVILFSVSYPSNNSRERSIVPKPNKIQMNFSIKTVEEQSKDIEEGDNSNLVMSRLNNSDKKKNPNEGMSC